MSLSSLVKFKHGSLYQITALFATEPKFVYQGGNFLLVDAAPDGNIAPSGFYFYYTINRRGLPSNGWTTYVSSAKETEAERMWNNLTDQG